jgi:hypothetical protein
MEEYFKEYLGDAVYVHHDGYHVWLTTGDGNNQRIAMEPNVWSALLGWHKKALVEFKRMRDEQPNEQ